MRLRYVKAALGEIEKSPYVVHDPFGAKGKWNDLFGNNNPLHLEIGTGKGRFLMDLAGLNPDISYVGMEKYSSVLYRAIQKMEDEPLPNLFFVNEDAVRLDEIFGENEVDRIYLNFSDPWPKKLHALRRLTSERFLPLYEKTLSPGSHIEFKTDNEGLFDYSVESLRENSWNILQMTRDLHNDPVMLRGNTMSEYEAKFSAMGNPIYKLIAAPGS